MFDFRNVYIRVWKNSWCGFSGYTSDAIVFEGIVTNERPPYFFHLTRPSAVSAGEYDYAGIEDAVIIITDVTDGIRDTLQYVPPRFEGYDVYYNYYNYDTKRKEETSGFSLGAVYGMYVTTKLYGIVGHSYSLDFYCDGQAFWIGSTENGTASRYHWPLKSKKVD